jgi:hypothetical protein
MPLVHVLAAAAGARCGVVVKAAHIISRAEMARRLGVSRAAVTRACKGGGRLEPSCSGSGVNVLHPAATRWLAQRKALAAAASPPTPSVDLPPEAPIPVDEIDIDPGPARATAAELELALGPEKTVDLDELARLLNQITERFGDLATVQPHVKCRKMLEEARKAEMLRQRIEGRLIARTTVIRMIGHIDIAFRLLLTDAPRTIATRLSAPDMAAATAMIRDVMSQQLAAARDHMEASLAADDPMAPLAEAAQ